MLMKGPEGVTVKPFATKLKGDSFIAKFSKSEVISIIDNPQAGDRYEIHVLGELEDASTFDLYDTITIKRRGKKK